MSLHPFSSAVGIAGRLFAILAIFVLGPCGCINADSDQEDQYDLIPAITAGDKQKVERLLDTPGVDVNWRAGGTTTPLLQAVQMGNLDLALLLLEKGADPNLPSDISGTPLSSAAYYGDVAMCQLLIEWGADVNKAAGRYKLTPLRTAYWKKRPDVIALLEKHGAKQ